MSDQEKLDPNDPKQAEENRIKEARERIKNSETFIVCTQPGKGVAIIGGVRHRSGINEQ
jgi:hypothetical protein